MGFTGKVALITGGAQGLGEAFSKTLLQQGAKVALVDLQAAKGQDTLKKLQSEFGANNVAFFQANVTSQEEFEGAFKSTKEKFGGLDIVINNAGISGETQQTWDRVVDVNVKGTIRGTLLAVDNLRKDKGGRGGVILNVSSVAGLRPNPCGPTYAATKSAIVMYSMCWAMNPELAANGVRINVLAPAFAATELFGNLKKPENCLLPQIADKIMDRAGIMTAEHVATTMLELLDDEQHKHGQIMTLAETTGKAYREIWT